MLTMALHSRELCKVGDSPSRCRRSVSPRRMMSVVTEDDGESDFHPNYHRRDLSPSPVGDNDSSPRISPRLTPSPSSSTASTPELQRSPSKGERRISARLLLQKGEKSESVLSKLHSGSSSPQGSKSPKQIAWKTSKFFSRSMASGELLKGLKKLSSPTSSAATEEPEPKASSSSSSESSKSFRNRFSSLRRKSGSDSDTVTNVDKESLKMGSEQVRGIVCKKEDIISLLDEVTKDRRVSSPEMARPPSPLPPSALQTPGVSSPAGRGSFKSCRSASLDPTLIPNQKSVLKHSHDKVPIKTIVHQPTITQEPSPEEEESEVPLDYEGKRKLSGSILIPKEEKEAGSNGESGGSEQDPTVQWDESNFVDPHLLGGAIEAFLKGMGSSQAPTTSGTNEKRVSFKKS